MSKKLTDILDDESIPHNNGKKLSKDSLDESLCDFCTLEEEQRGVKSDGSGEPYYCVDSGLCDVAYDNYSDAFDYIVSHHKTGK